MALEIAADNPAALRQASVVPTNSARLGPWHCRGRLPWWRHSGCGHPGFAGNRGCVDRPARHLRCHAGVSAAERNAAADPVSAPSPAGAGVGAWWARGWRLAGLLFQGLFRNPIADPYVIGSSGGAVFGACIGIFFFSQWSVFGFSATALLAFAGSAATMAVVYALARSAGKTNVVTLLLAGFAISTMFTNTSYFFELLDRTGPATAFSSPGCTARSAYLPGANLA